VGEEVNNENFRLANKYIFLTYKTHLDKLVFIEWLNKKCKEKINWIRLAHETGDKTTLYNHTHVLAEHQKIFETKNSRFFDYEEIHPHIKKLKTKKAFECAKGYIAKEDIENKDLKEKNVNIVKAIMECGTTKEALEKYCNTPSNAPGIIAIRNEMTHSYRRRTPLIEPTHDWQKEFIKDLCDEEKPPNHRDVHWYYDKKGNTGKSTLTRWIKSLNNDWYSCTEVNQCKDLAPVILNALESGWAGWGWIFDLPRDAEDHKGFYSGIECLKNGEITGTKYKGKTVTFDIPYVVVFANFLPKTYKMSLDRWKIYEIDRENKAHKLDAYRLNRDAKWAAESGSESSSDCYYGTLGIVADDEEDDTKERLH